MTGEFFSESIVVPCLGDRIMGCEVKANDDFIAVITDEYEGYAQMSHELAEKVHEALGRAIAAVRAHRAEQS